MTQNILSIKRIAASAAIAGVVGAGSPANAQVAGACADATSVIITLFNAEAAGLLAPGTAAALTGFYATQCASPNAPTSLTTLICGNPASTVSPTANGSLCVSPPA